MKTNITELVFILDRSGSMHGLEGDTIGGYNSLLKKQKKQTNPAMVTTVLFDDYYEVLHSRENIKTVSPITKEQYYVRGSTALLDAMGKTILRISRKQKSLPANKRADNVVIVITTDGYENASTEFTSSKVKSLVEQHKEKYGWEFIFLGANIDSFATAESFGISRNRAANYHADSQGTKKNFSVLSRVMDTIRSGYELEDECMMEIHQDFESRK